MACIAFVCKCIRCVIGRQRVSVTGQICSVQSKDMFCIVVCATVVKFCSHSVAYTLMCTCVCMRMPSFTCVYCEVFQLLLMSADNTWTARPLANLWFVCFASVSVPSLLVVCHGNVFIPRLWLFWKPVLGLLCCPRLAIRTLQRLCCL